MAFPNTPILDSFDRSDSNPLDGNWTNGFYGDGNLILESNAIHANAEEYGGAAYNTSYGANQEVYIAAVDVNSGVALWVRVTYSDITNPDGYSANFGAETNSLYSVVDGVSTELATYATTNTAGVSYGLSANGNTISVWEKVDGTWSQLASVADTAITGGGKIAVECQNLESMDDFGGGEIPDPVPVELTLRPRLFEMTLNPRSYEATLRPRSFELALKDK